MGQRFPNRAYGRYVVLLGKETDVKIAEYVLEFLNNTNSQRSRGEPEPRDACVERVRGF
jgi:hypothetical protein